MSEPQHIKEILPDVMSDIKRKMERQRRKQNRAGVIQAAQDFIFRRPKKSHSNRTHKQRIEQGKLW